MRTRAKPVCLLEAIKSILKQASYHFPVSVEILNKIVRMEFKITRIITGELRNKIF